MLFNLSKGKLWEEVSESLGRFIIAQVKAIALGRAKLPASLRKEIYLVIDEADTFIKGDSLNIILKETRKYWLHLLLATQNLVSWKEQEKLKRNLINNTNVKVIGANGLSTLKALAWETGIPIKKLLQLDFHEFAVKYWAKQKRFISSKPLFGSHSPLLVKRGNVHSLTHRMVKKTGYYKPISPAKVLEQDQLLDRSEKRAVDQEAQAYPKPKFTL